MRKKRPKFTLTPLPDFDGQTPLMESMLDHVEELMEHARDAKVAPVAYAVVVVSARGNARLRWKHNGGMADYALSGAVDELQSLMRELRKEQFEPG